MTKADYIKAQPQSRKHACHWPGCDKQVPPAMWGCSSHWFMLPKPIRDNIWRTYRPGQEILKNPSADYIEAAKVAQDWIADYLAAKESRLAQMRRIEDMFKEPAAGRPPAP